MHCFVGESENRRNGESSKHITKDFAGSPSRKFADSDVREGRIARYARGPDYHKVIGKRLDSLVRYLSALAPQERCKTFVDTAPLLERPLAQRAGRGFIGKNTMI